MDWKFWLTLAVNLIGLWLMWRADQKQARYMNPQALQNAIAALPWYAALWKRYWPILVMFLLMIGSWMPYFFQTPDLAKSLEFYGTVGPLGAPWPMPGIPPEVHAVVDGRMIYSYRKTHHLAAVAFHQIGASDQDDITALQKSAQHDIREGDIDVVIPVSDAFMDEIHKGYRMTNYRILLLPNDVKMEDFQSLRGAYKLGAILLGGGGGPP